MDEIPSYLLSVKPQNWNFESVLDSELEECWFYEAGRELPNIRKRIDYFRTNSKARTFEELRSAGTDGYATIKGFSARWKGISPYCPEFPEGPFLDIPPQERKRRINAYRSPDQRRFFRALRFESDLSKVLADFRPSDVRNGVIPSDLDEFAIAAFTIHWSLSDKELLSEFANWLLVNRTSLSGIPVSEKRGAGASIRQLKKKLKVLGAMRLLRSLDCQEARAHSSEHRRDGKPLYTDQSAWIRARSDATKFLAQLSPKRSA